MNFGVKKRYPMHEFNHKLINWPWVWLLIWLICGIRNQICIFLKILVILKTLDHLISKIRWSKFGRRFLAFSDKINCFDKIQICRHAVNQTPWRSLLKFIIINSLAWSRYRAIITLNAIQMRKKNIKYNLYFQIFFCKNESSALKYK